MAGFTLTEWINAPAEPIFDFIIDPSNGNKLGNNISETVQLTEGEIGLGTRFRETRIENGKPNTYEMEVVAFERNRRYAAQVIVSGIVTVYEYIFSAENAGTRCTMEATVTAKGLKKMMAPAVAGMLKKQDGDHLHTLKKVIEADFSDA